MIEAADPNWTDGLSPELVIVYGDHRRRYLECYTMEAIDEVDAKIDALPRGSMERKDSTVSNLSRKNSDLGALVAAFRTPGALETMDKPQLETFQGKFESAFPDLKNPNNANHNPELCQQLPALINARRKKLGMGEVLTGVMSPKKSAAGATAGKKGAAVAASAPAATSTPSAAQQAATAAAGSQQGTPSMRATSSGNAQQWAGEGASAEGNWKGSQQGSNFAGKGNNNNPRDEFNENTHYINPKGAPVDLQTDP